MNSMITIASNYIDPKKRGGEYNLTFHTIPHEKVYSRLSDDPIPHPATGSIKIAATSEEIPDPTSFGEDGDQVRLVVQIQESPSTKTKEVFITKGYVRDDGGWRESPLQVIHVSGELHSRLDGLIETDILSDQSVFFVGFGSVGSTIVRFLVQSGVKRFHIMDHDRIELCNIARHEARLRDVGRLKVDFAEEDIRQKNPEAEVHTWPVKSDEKNLELCRRLIRENTLTICTADSRTCRDLTNYNLIKEGKTGIFAGCRRRAYGGMVMIVRSGRPPCYNCYTHTLPDEAKDREIANAEAAEEIQYSDRPVPIEPGLSLDIDPISQFTGKLALQELLRNKPTTLRSLDEDLSDPLYFWYNRRENGEDSERFQPLSADPDDVHILRWIPVQFDPNPHCPTCGDYLAYMKKIYGLNP
ncbi:MAG: ThiF family adenylyltransferase [Candidatus Omnitrophica bacterium]|nr:ThiF family adenylyltransferase [Candidatus Omnitrophota bacterium]